MPTEPPRREESGTEPARRGAGRRDPAEPVPFRREEGRGQDVRSAAPVRRDGARTKISDARGYTPRGRTVRESSAGTRDSFRPALELVRDPDSRPGRSRDQSGTVPPRKPGQPGTGRGANTLRDPGNLGDGGTPRQRIGGTGTTTRSYARRPGTGSGRGGAGTGYAGGRAGAGVRGRPVRGGQVGRGAQWERGGRPKIRKVVRRRPPRLGEPIRRLRLGAALVMVLFLVLAGRLVILQLADAGQIARTGLEDRLRTEVLFAPRGTIYDQGHNVLAQSIEARYVFADPSRVDTEKLDQTAAALRDLLGVPVSELMPLLTKTKRENGSIDEFEYLKRGVSIADAEKVAALNIAGIGVGRDEIRVEPGNDLAANLIGFTGQDGTGLYGLENSEDSLLAGVDGKRLYEVGNGALGTQIPGGYEEVKAAHPGSSLELTIDQDVQFTAQQVLYKQMTKVNALFGCALVIDVHTGDIRAQASYPTYNAANPAGTTEAQKAENCTQTVIDPGSIHKVITLGAALQTGVINADSTVPICPTVTKGDTTFHDTHPLHCGTNITLPGILAFSSNVGTIGVASKFGASEDQIIYDYQRLFGLGQSTNGGIPAESAGLLQKPGAWSGSAYGSVPIGLGVSATPLQMAAVYATIANGGAYVTPRLLKAVIAPDGTVRPCPPSATHQVLSPANAAILRQDLEAVVTAPGATGHAAAITGYRVAGKTGTGQFVGADGRYAPGTVASFIGMAPADAPRYVVAVFVYTPGGDEGGKAAAPAFHDLMSYTLGHYHVPPTGTNPPTFATTR